MKPTKTESRTQAYKRITDGIRNFVNHSVGAAKLVLEAKRTEIWNEKWSSWQEYCEKEFGKTKQRVHQLLEVASAIEEIQTSTMVDAKSGKNKGILDKMTYRQAKELKGLPPAQKADIFDRAVAVSGGKAPRPETIAKVRIQNNGRAPDIPPVRLDKVGRPIPPEILPAWDHAHEVGTRLRQVVSDVKCEIQAGLGHDRAYAELSNTIISDAEALHFSLSYLLPHSVCPYCQGRVPGNCRPCHGRGFVSKHFYQGPTVGTELRAIVETEARSYANQSVSA